MVLIMVLNVKKSNSSTRVYHNIAFDKTTSMTDCELYCDLIIDIDQSQLRRIIFCNYIRRNFNLAKKYCEIAIQKNTHSEYAHKILCELHIRTNKTSPEDIEFIEKQFILSGSNTKLINTMCDFFSQIDKIKYRKYLELGSENNLLTCTNKLGLLCVKEKKFPEALEYFNQCVNNKYYQAGLNLAKYYIEIEPDDLKVEKYFNMVVSNGHTYLKKIASERYIMWLHKKKNFTKAESLLSIFDQSRIDGLCWHAEHHFRAGNLLWGENYVNDAIKLFESRLKKPLEFEQVKKKFDKISTGCVNLTTFTESLFPIGLWVYADIIKGSKFKELFVNNKILRFYSVFEDLVARTNQCKSKFTRYGNWINEFLSGLIESKEQNKQNKTKPNSITPETIYKGKPIGKWFYNTISLIKYYGDCVHSQFDKFPVIFNIITNELEKKTIETCGICQDDLNIFVPLIKLQCCSQDKFHSQCMENWKKQCRLANKNWSCPFCRANLDI